MDFKSLKKIMRPFTLMYPAMAMLSGGLLAFNLSNNINANFIIIRIIGGMIISSLLNGASNIFNQIFDYEIDKINKAERPLPLGTITMKEAYGIAIFLSGLCIGISWYISLEYFIMVIIALSCTLIYSAPPIRSKKYHWYANLTMAIPRGLLLIVAGWSTIAPISEKTPWLFGSILFIYILGANTAKDFSDIEGDKINGVISLPIKYGEKTIDIIKPFFIWPFFMIIMYYLLGWINWIFLLLIGFSWMGNKTVKLLKKAPNLKEIDNNHPSWKLMYLTVALYTLSIAFLSFFV